MHEGHEHAEMSHAAKQFMKSKKRKLGHKGS